MFSIFMKYFKRLQRNGLRRQRRLALIFGMKVVLSLAWFLNSCKLLMASRLGICFEFGMKNALNLYYYRKEKRDLTQL